MFEGVNSFFNVGIMVAGSAASQVDRPAGSGSGKGQALSAGVGDGLQGPRHPYAAIPVVMPSEPFAADHERSVAPPLSHLRRLSPQHRR